MSYWDLHSFIKMLFDILKAMDKGSVLLLLDVVRTYISPAGKINSFNEWVEEYLTPIFENIDKGVLERDDKRYYFGTAEDWRHYIKELDTESVVYLEFLADLNEYFEIF